jgi:predicted site-specific integrase-resolvase
LACLPSAQAGCKIIVISEIGSPQLDSQEVFEEIVSLLHCYSMKLYSARKRKKIKELIEEEVES